MEKTQVNKTVRLTETAVMLAAAVALSFIKFIDMPFGGSVTLFSMLPIAVISYRYRMVYFLLLDQPETPVRVLASKAAAMNRPHRISLFLLDLSFAPWVLLCLLTCGILFVWKLPYMAATYAHAYAFMEKDYEARQQRMEALLEAQKKRMEETGLFRR